MDVSLPNAAIVGVLSSAVLASIVTAGLTHARANANERRDRYTQAIRALAAWGEYPYRIRRRVNDDPATLTTLANQGHDIQESMAEARAWIAAESAVASQVFDRCIAELSRTVGPACQQAWKSPSVLDASAMNLNDFGPRNIQQVLVWMECTVRYRFGMRRLTPDRLAIRQLCKKGLPSALRSRC
jgi:hypothetical protein